MVSAASVEDRDSKSGLIIDAYPSEDYIVSLVIDICPSIDCAVLNDGQLSEPREYTY